MSPGGNLLLRFATAMLLCCALAGVARAEEAPPPLTDHVGPSDQVVELALRAAVVRALESNLEIAVERYNPDIKDAEVLTAKGEFDPNVKGEFTYSDEEIPQTTVEGLAREITQSGDGLHPLQRAFLDADAVACGFCIPGMLMSAKALLDGNPNPTREEIRRGISGNLCRCTGYIPIIEAIERAAEEMRAK